MTKCPFCCRAIDRTYKWFPWPRVLLYFFVTCSLLFGSLWSYEIGERWRREGSPSMILGATVVLSRGGYLRVRQVGPGVKVLAEPKDLICEYLWHAGPPPTIEYAKLEGK